MANHQSALKAHKRSLVRAAGNRSVKSRVKTFSGKVEAAIKSGNVEEAVSAFRIAESQIMQGVSKGVLKLNNASRRVSKLAKRVKMLAVQPA